jgi:hypothetical protein
VLQDLSIEILAEINIRPNETNAETLTQKLATLKPKARIFLPLLGENLTSYTGFLKAMKVVKNRGRIRMEKTGKNPIFWDSHKVGKTRFFGTHTIRFFGTHTN